MRFYGLSDSHLMNMPVRRFWLLARNVKRISAEEEIRSLKAYQHSMSNDAASEYTKTLEAEIGLVSYQTPTRDEAEIKRFKMKISK